MTGRELYERWCRLQAIPPTWLDLHDRQQDAWNDLATELALATSTESEGME